MLKSLRFVFWILLLKNNTVMYKCLLSSMKRTDENTPPGVLVKYEEINF
jgi:hypothetical protein